MDKIYDILNKHRSKEYTANQVTVFGSGLIGKVKRLIYKVKRDERNIE